MRISLLLVAVLAAAGCGSTQAPRAKAPAPSPTPDASDINREAKAPALIHVYKIEGDDPMPWTLTVRADRTANLIVGGGHTGGNDKVVHLTRAVTERAKRLVAAVPWKRVAGHTVEPGGFGGNDNMARYMLRRGRISTVYAAGDMPRRMARLVHLLDRIMNEEVGTVVASDGHFSSNGGILPEPSAPAPTPNAAQINRDAKAPELVHVYKTVGDDPYPWTLTVRTDRTANLIVGGGHGGGNDKVVRLSPAVAQRAERLVAAVPWKHVAGHTVEPGGFGGNDNMARYMLRHGTISTVYAAGDMPPRMGRLVHLLDQIIDEDVGTVVAADARHGNANAAVLTEP